MEKQYIVGMDFGHGETAVWAVPMSLSVGAEKGVSLRLKASNNGSERSYYSVIYSDAQGNLCLDDLKGNVISGFKDKVSNLNLPHNANKRRAFSEYIKQIYKRMIELNSSLLTVADDGSTNFYLCIACPTKWSSEDKKDYINFFNEALAEFGVEIMWVINESDAAYFSHGSVNEYGDKCVLIIDYGSSTIDYTVVYCGKKISDDMWSNNLGASNIEESILNKCRGEESYQASLENTTAKLAELGMGHIDINSCVKFEVRKAKEYSVTYDKYPRLVVDCNLVGEKSVYGTTDEFKAEKNKFRFEAECQMDECLTAYQSAVVEDFTSLKAKIQERIGPQQIDKVILSGGACQMPWVMSVVDEVFEPVSIELDNEASFVVAKGIAFYAKAQMEALENFKRRISTINFGSIYKQADTIATRQAVLTLMPKMVKRLKGCYTLTASEIRKSFCDFIQSLDGDNVEYATLVQQEFNLLVSNSVGQALKEAILDVFNVTVDTSDVKLDIPVNIISWNPCLFVEGGAFYEVFTQLITSSSDAIFGSWFFKWNQARKDPELAQIINGVATALENFVRENPLADYSQVQSSIDDYAAVIRTQALDEGVNIFYAKQLFNTTFKK